MTDRTLTVWQLFAFLEVSRTMADAANGSMFLQLLYRMPARDPEFRSMGIGPLLEGLAE